jgi:hypothetical protein
VAKFKNIYGENIQSGPLGNRLVLEGQVVEISDELAAEYVWGAPFWEPVSETKSKTAAKSATENPED